MLPPWLWRHQAELLPRAVSGTVILLQLASVMLSTACVNTAMLEPCLAELLLRFIDTEIARLAPCWILQQANWSYPSWESLSLCSPLSIAMHFTWEAHTTSDPVVKDAGGPTLSA